MFEVVEQHGERLGIIHIVPRRQEFDGQTDLLGPLKRGPEHAIGAPDDIFKQSRMSPLQADQIIAAIDRRPEHGPISGAAQRLDRLLNNSTRQRRKIGTDQHDAVMTFAQQGFSRTGHDLAKRGIAAAHETELCRHEATDRVFGSGWRINGIRFGPQRRVQRGDDVGDIPEKVGRQFRTGIRAEDGM